MKVLVIIVNYNGSRWIPKVSEALRSEAEALRKDGVVLDLFVFDNASEDGSVSLWTDAWPGVILQGSEGNLGFTAGNNAGFRYALEHGYDFVYLLNQDAWPCEGMFSQLLSCFRPGYALLSPLQMTGDGAHYDPNFARDVLPKSRSDAKDSVHQVPRVMAAHWLVSCEALKQIGLFEPLLPLYGQDDNWCDRAAFHGFRVGCLDTARGIHDRAARKEPKDRIIYRNYYMGSLVRLLDIRRPLWRQRLFVGLFTLVKTVKYGSLQPLKYHRSLRRQLKEIRAARETTRKPAAYV
ncbi:MAG: glycosyltransferase family 2 protein [Bacteroidota bacterium]|nr:glycosyltransferase family 2 protein [Bacteroidota bacterium]